LIGCVLHYITTPLEQYQAMFKYYTRLKYSASLAIVVLSPPGMIRELMVRSCSGFRISTPLTPNLLKTAIDTEKMLKVSEGMRKLNEKTEKKRSRICLLCVR